MKIINATCYLTEDLEAIAARVIETLEDKTGAIRAATDGYYHRLDPEAVPETLRVGYYTPADDPAKTKERKANSRYFYGPEFIYVSLRGQYQKDARLGIVKKKHLQGHALSVLASVADGDYPPVPDEVRDEVVCALIKLFRQTTHNFKNRKQTQYQAFDAIWSWVDSFKLRYRDRAKRGSRAEAKRAREIAAYQNTLVKINRQQSEIATMEAELEYARNALTELETRAFSEKERLGL